MPLSDHLGSSAYVPGDGLSISEKRGFLGAENFMMVRAANSRRIPIVNCLFSVILGNLLSALILGG